MVMLSAPNAYQQHILRQVANNYRLTPMTLACRLNPKIIPAKHLMYIAAKVAAAIAKGNGRLLISVPPRHGKPISIEELILMGDGTYRRLGDIEVGDMVVTHKGRAQQVTAVYEQGALPAVKITTRANRQVTAALDHPFMTQRGWVNAGAITVNDVLVTVSPNVGPGAGVVIKYKHGTDAVKSLELVDPVECRCLTVAEDETFCVRDIVVHNSELITKNTPIWALENYGDKSVLLTSYGAELSTDFGRKIRDLVQANSSVIDLRIRKDARQVGNWLTDTGGAMMSVGLGGAITGRGADILLIDDYIKSIKEALSKVTRDYIWNWFTTTAYTRLEPGGTAIIIATRWHDDDLIGRILKDDTNHRWEYIRIPAIAEENDVLGRKIGEALFPERYDIDRLLEIKEQMGTYYFNALFQQDPEDENAKLTNTEWLQITNELPDLYVCKTARVWDFASTEGGGDYATGTHIAYNPRLDLATITNVQRVQYSPNRLEELVCRTAREDGPNCTILIEQEPGASGKQLTTHYQTILPQFKVVAIPVSDGKLARSQPFLAACEAGKIFLYHAAWNKAFIDEFKTFPGGDHDDQVDTAGMGYTYLSLKKTLTTSWGRTPQEDTGTYYGEKQDPRLIKRSAGIVFGR